MEQNSKKLLKEFKNKNSLDFRFHKYLIHSNFYNYKSSTYFSYDFAKKIILDLNNFLKEKFQEQLVIYNLSMDINSLNDITLKHYIEGRIEDYLIYNKSNMLNK